MKVPSPPLVGKFNYKQIDCGNQNQNHPKGIEIHKTSELYSQLTPTKWL